MLCTETFGGRQMRSLNRFEDGFSLVELLIAIGLSLVLLAGTLVVFSSNRESYMNIEHLSLVQENGRYALDLMVRDIRSAGYNGCAKPAIAGVATTGTVLNPPLGLAWQFDQALSGFEGSSATAFTPALDASLTTYAPTNLSDILVVRLPKPGALGARVSSLLSPGTADVSVFATTPAPIAQNDVVMISNCEAREFFQVTAYSVTAGIGSISHGAVAAVASTYTPGNASSNLYGNGMRTTFTTDAEVIPVITNTYFVAPICPACTPPNLDTALWRKPSTGGVEELVDGVNAMQILYGVDTDQDQQADTYVTANNVTNWNAVISVRIALLVYSLEQYGTAADTTKTYTLLNAAAVGPYNDRRMRQLFTATATLRNKTR